MWTLGNGIGYGRYPHHDGVWEAGHSVVTLDPKEHFCGCGGPAHLEGIMGQRAMRLRFMDMEPEEIFEQAKAGETRCVDFVKLWHRALAAGTATSIHLDGPGKFYISGFNSRFVNVTLLSEYLNEMVKLSPLQGYSLEVVKGGEEIALIGAAVNASRWRITQRRQLAKVTVAAAHRAAPTARNRRRARDNARGTGLSAIGEDWFCFRCHSMSTVWADLPVPVKPGN